jgi:aminomethyltransferase
VQRTELYESHKGLGAKLVDFAGFEMPIQYHSIKEEILAVRNDAGVFDVSHMGEFICSGPEAVKFLDYLVPNQFLQAPTAKAVYSPLLNQDGKILDDLILYKLSEEKVLICVNASNIKKDWDWISRNAQKFDCTLENHSDNYSLLALQGPKSAEKLKEKNILTKEQLNCDYYSAFECDIHGHKSIVARTGYTGEDGFEIFSTHEGIKTIWGELLEAGVVPCGLGARDILRLEVCYPLYGNELNETKTPLDTGLKWTVKMDKEDFIGKSALLESSPEYKPVKLSLERGIPRSGYPINNAQGEAVGIVTSGGMSVTLGHGVALASIEKSKWPENKEFFIEIRGKQYPAKIHTKPFFKGGHK